MSPAVLSLLTFLAVSLGVAGAYSILSDLFLRERTRVSSRLDEEFHRKQRQKVERSTLFRNLQQYAAEFEAETPEEERRTIAQRFTKMVDQSGLDITPKQLLIFAGGAGLFLGALGGIFVKSVVLALILAPVGFAIPIVYVQKKKQSRLEKLSSQLPDAFDLMARMIRAGQTMSQALLGVADEFPLPIAAEFSYCYEQQNLGLPPDVAYKDLARRNDIVEIKMFVMALLVQQQTGGNLAELLDKLSSLLRDRFRIQGLVRTLTAEGRMQAIVLMAMPPFLFVVMLVLNPAYSLKLFDYPSLLIISLVSEGLGALWIRKIVNFDF